MHIITHKKKQELINNIFSLYLYGGIFIVMSYIFTKENIYTSLFYAIMGAISIFFAKISDRNKHNNMVYILYSLLSFSVLFFLYGFRNYSGIDDPVYIRIFENVSQIGWFQYFVYSTMEPGYLMLNYIVSIFTEKYLYLQIVTSSIPLILYYRAFYKNRKSISLPVAVYLLFCMIYFQMLSVALVRMFIAMGIVFNSLPYIEKGRMGKFVLGVLLASLFHYSSFITIFLVLFAKKEKKINFTKIYYLLFLLTPLAFTFIGKFIVPLLGSRYQIYGEFKSINVNINSFTTLPLILLLLFYRKKIEEKDLFKFDFYTFIFATSIIISIFGDMIGLGRLIFYAYSAFIYAASIVNRHLKFTSSKIIFSSAIIIYGIVYLFYTQFTNIHHIPNLFPYDNIYFKI